MHVEIQDDKIYKFMFENDGDYVIKCCKVTAVTAESVFFDEPVGIEENVKHKAIRKADVETVMMGGKYKVVYLDRMDLAKAKDILIAYHRNRIEILKAKIEKELAKIDRISNADLKQKETGNA